MPDTLNDLEHEIASERLRSINEQIRQLVFSEDGRDGQPAAHLRPEKSGGRVMPRYSHVFEIIFSVPSDCADAVDVTPDDLWRALRSRLQIPVDEIEEAAIFCAEDTFEVHPEDTRHVKT